MRLGSKGLTFKKIQTLFYGYEKQGALALLWMVISGILETANLASIYPLIHYSLDQPPTDKISIIFSSILSFFNITPSFFSSCCFLICITFVSLLFKLLNTYLSCSLQKHIIANFQKQIFTIYLSAKYEFFSKHQQGDLIHTGTTATEQTASLVLHTLKLCNDFIIFLSMISFLMFLSFYGFLGLCILGALYSVSIKTISKKVLTIAGDKSISAQRRKHVLLNECLTGIRTIKILQSQHYWMHKYFHEIEQQTQSQFQLLLGRSLPDIWMRLLFFIMIAVSGMFLSTLTQNQFLSLLPAFATFGLVSSRLFPVIQAIGNDIMYMIESLPAAENVLTTLALPTVSLPHLENHKPAFDSELRIENLWFRFNTQQDWLLKGIHLTVKKNKMIALVGPSGHGKTTLLHVLLGLYPPSQGKVFLDHKEIDPHNDPYYLNLFGYVGQDPFIFNASIKENITFGWPCQDAQMHQAAEIANVWEFVKIMPDGYQSIVGDSGMKLSGGQKQRIALARAILRRPEILVLDEATSALDNLTEAKVQTAIHNIAKTTTILIIAHRLTTIQNADSILVIKDGQIIEQGKHEDLLMSETFYKTLHSQHTRNTP